MLDINGREVTIKAEQGYHGYGAYPFSITMETRQGRRGFRATWLPTNNSARFGTKREATAFVKAHERIAYGR
jgi:hypothetical protein